MVTIVQDIEQFFGLRTDVDEVSMPLGGALSCAGLAQYLPDRIQRIPGVTTGTSIPNSDGGIKLGWVTTIAGTEYIMFIAVDGSNVARLYRSDGTEVTGTALTNTSSGIYSGMWDAAEYLGARYFTGGNQAIQKIATASTRSDVASSPKGHLLKSYLGRLYLAGMETVPGGAAASDVDKSRVFFTGSLTETFNANYFLYIDEIPGNITSLAVNSPTSAAGTIIGELLIAKNTGIAKLSGDPGDESASLTVVSSVIGSDAPHTFANTPMGTVFMGKSGGRYNVYLLPVGSQGEPIEIGTAIAESLLTLSTPSLSFAVYHDGFYKMFVADAAGIGEFWFDVRYYVSANIVRWFGIHRRGVKSAPSVSDSTKELYVCSSTKWHKENTSKASGFTDASGSTIAASLDLPLNVVPVNDEKVFDLLNLFIAKEANTSGNQASVTTYIEGVSQGSSPIDLYDATTIAGANVEIALVGTNGASIVGQTARIKLDHTLDSRMDILKIYVQCLAHRARKVRV